MNILHFERCLEGMSWSLRHPTGGWHFICQSYRTMGELHKQNLEYIDWRQCQVHCQEVPCWLQHSMKGQKEVHWHKEPLNSDRNRSRHPHSAWTQATISAIRKGQLQSGPQHQQDGKRACCVPPPQCPGSSRRACEWSQGQWQGVRPWPLQTGLPGSRHAQRPSTRWN